MTINCKKRIKGTYFPPGDKSISHRILILTGQAVGPTLRGAYRESHLQSCNDGRARDPPRATICRVEPAVRAME